MSNIHLRPYLRTPPFVVEHAGAGRVPVYGILREDGRQQLALMLIFSDHLGAELLRLHAADFGIEGSDADVLELANNTELLWAMVTSPVEDKLKPDECAWNVSRAPAELASCVAAGIVEKTGAFGCNNPGARRLVRAHANLTPAGPAEDLVIVRMLKVMHLDLATLNDFTLLPKDLCEWCEKPAAAKLKRCTGCHQARYCSEQWCARRL